MTTTVETIEQADWRIEGNPRMSDAAIHACTLLFFDLVDAEDHETAESEAPA